VARWAGLVGWLTGRLMVAGLSPINSRELPIMVRAVFTFVAVETPSNLLVEQWCGFLDAAPWRDSPH